MAKILRYIRAGDIGADLTQGEVDRLEPDYLQSLIDRRFYAWFDTDGVSLPEIIPDPPVAPEPIVITTPEDATNGVLSDSTATAITPTPILPDLPKWGRATNATYASAWGKAAETPEASVIQPSEGQSPEEAKTEEGTN